MGGREPTRDGFFSSLYRLSSSPWSSSALIVGSVAIATVETAVVAAELVVSTAESAFPFSAAYGVL